GHKVASCLDDELHLVTVLLMEQVERGIEHALAHGVEQNLAASEYDATDLLSRPARLRVAIIQVQIGHPIGEVLDDASVIGDALPDHALPLRAVVRPEAVLVAVMTSAMTEKRRDVIERFHFFSLVIARRASATVPRVSKRRVLSAACLRAVLRRLRTSPS